MCAAARRANTAPMNAECRESLLRPVSSQSAAASQKSPGHHNHRSSDLAGSAVAAVLDSSTCWPAACTTCSQQTNNKRRKRGAAETRRGGQDKANVSVFRPVKAGCCRCPSPNEEAEDRLMSSNADKGKKKKRQQEVANGWFAGDLTLTRLSDLCCS